MRRIKIYFIIFPCKIIDVIQLVQEVGLIRRPASFVTSMTDERGDELMYSGVKISEVVESGKGIGGVMALLWFQV